MNADPLVWGHGPRVLEVFLEPTCPFSGRAFGKFDELLARAGEDRLTLKLRLQSQPWHLYSPVTTRAVLAAGMTGGQAAAKAVLAALFANRDAFEPAEHCQGALLDATPRALLAQLEALSGVALAEAWQNPAVTPLVKWQARYARQNGIHVSPTFMVDGVVLSDMGSGDTVEAWLGKLGLG